MKQIILLPNNKNLKEKIGMFGNVWYKIKKEDMGILVESLHGESLIWVEPEDIKE